MYDEEAKMKQFIKWQKDKIYELEKENEFFKKVIKASMTMNMHYRIGKPTMPEWVLDTLMKAREKYGDLHKIK